MNIALSIQYFPGKTFSSLKNLPDSKIFLFLYKTGGEDCPLGESWHYLKISPFIFRQEVTEWGRLLIGYIHSLIAKLLPLIGQYFAKQILCYARYFILLEPHNGMLSSSSCVFKCIPFDWYKSKSAQFCLIFRVNESTHCNIEK